MNDKYYEALRELQTQMEEEYKTVRKSVNRPTWPQLMITKSRTRTDYLAVTYINGKRVKHYIKKDPGYIYRLAHKAYIKEYALRLRADMGVISAAVRAFDRLDYNSVLRSLPKHFDILDPEFVTAPGKLAVRNAYPDPSLPGKLTAGNSWTDPSAPGKRAVKRAYPNPSPGVAPADARLELADMDAWEWAAEPYCENTDHPETKTHITREGLCCRSKSEALIFGIYMSLGLPFHYDETVMIGGRRISPDFIGVRRDGRFVYHEHCGLNSEQYRSRSDRKTWLYASAGIYPGDNLIYTYDDPNGSINAKLAEALIRDAYKL